MNAKNALFDQIIIGNYKMTGQAKNVKTFAGIGFVIQPKGR